MESDGVREHDLSDPESAQCHSHSDLASSRRSFLATIAALPFVMSAGSASEGAGTADRGPRAGAIDVHHHFLPDFYKPRIERWLKGNASNVAEAMSWTPESSLAAMDKAGVATAVLSISAPGFDMPTIGDAPELARQCNDYAARMSRVEGRRFRFFAGLPMPDVVASIREAARGLDELGADGVGLLTNYGGRYLGDAAFVPLFKELARKRSVVYIHPTTTTCCHNIVPEQLDALVEFPVDTARTISSLLWSGTLSRFPEIRFIFSHGGGVIPMVIERVAAMGYINPALARRVPEGALAALARLYVDTASVANPIAFSALRSWLSPDRILFGTDYPWGAPDRALADLDRIGLTPTALDGVRRGNALQLLGAANGSDNSR